MNARLQLQRLGRQTDQVLVLAHLAGLRDGRGIFRTGEVQRLFVQLRVPAPANVSRVLADLRSRRLVLSVGGGAWGLTPEGEAHVADLAITWSSADVSLDYAAEFGGATHYTIPPELAPLPLVGPIERFLTSFPFERNVFAITRFPREGRPDDPMPAALVEARTTLGKYGLQLHLASDRSVADELWPNVSSSMWACRFGVAIIEDAVGEGINRNVLIELGAMLMTGRRCVLLKDSTVERVPSDLIGHIRKDVQITQLSTIAAALSEWAEADLGLRSVA